MLSVGRAVSPRGKLGRKARGERERVRSAHVSRSFDEYVLLCDWISCVCDE